MPLEIQSHTIPHLKALISGKMEPRRLRCGNTFILCHALLNTAILLHKEAYRADLFSSHCTASYIAVFVIFVTDYLIGRGFYVTIYIFLVAFKQLKDQGLKSS